MFYLYLGQECNNLSYFFYYLIASCFFIPFPVISAWEALQNFIQQMAISNQLHRSEVINSLLKYFPEKFQRCFSLKRLIVLIFVVYFVATL